MYRGFVTSLTFSQAKKREEKNVMKMMKDCHLETVDFTSLSLISLYYLFRIEENINKQTNNTKKNIINNIITT